MGSVASYALRYNQCPIEAVDRAKRYENDLYWAIELATVISDPPTKLEECIALEIGDRIYFEGHIFKLNRTRNGNVGLELID